MDCALLASVKYLAVSGGNCIITAAHGSSVYPAFTLQCKQHECVAQETCGQGKRTGRRRWSENSGTVPSCTWGDAATVAARLRRGQTASVAAECVGVVGGC
jgi:hypothetical protein